MDHTLASHPQDQLEQVARRDIFPNTSGHAKSQAPWNKLFEKIRILWSCLLIWVLLEAGRRPLFIACCPRGHLYPPGREGIPAGAHTRNKPASPGGDTRARPTRPTDAHARSAQTTPATGRCLYRALHSSPP